MIRDHIRLDDGVSTGGSGMNKGPDASVRLQAGGDYTTRDELYLKSLRESLRTRSMLASTQNAARFIPDEQLLSSAKRREAAEMANASRLVPLRRRDRLQELLLLENKARLREEARLRAERRALGLPEEEDETGQGEDKAGAQEADATGVQDGSLPGSQAGSGANTPHGSLGSDDGAALTPASRCSAEHELHATLRELKRIAAQDSTASQKTLSREQIQQLRKIVHEQSKKARAMAAESDHQPHLCNHCFSVNVQAKHLCPKMTGSVAFDQTGKVINPAEGVKFGTQRERGLDGTYSNAYTESLLASQKTRLDRYNPHPCGTGVVFPPLNAGNTTQDGQRRRVRGHPLMQTMFNNNIGPDEVVEDGLQYPGSTYNVYDELVQGAEEDRQATKTADKRGAGQECVNHHAGTAEATSGLKALAKSDATSGNTNTGDGSDRVADGTLSATRLGKGVTADGGSRLTSSSLWRTTNQDREADMQRFLEFQKRMKGTARRVYDAGSTQREEAAPLTSL